jgi:hypothetical protein
MRTGRVCAWYRSRQSDGNASESIGMPPSGSFPFFWRSHSGGPGPRMLPYLRTGRFRQPSNWQHGKCWKRFQRQCVLALRTDAADDDPSAIVTAPRVFDPSPTHRRVDRGVRQRIGRLEPDPDNSRRRSVEWRVRRHARYDRYSPYRENRHSFKRRRLSEGGESMVTFHPLFFGLFPMPALCS